jgi:hypothetical protein
MALAKQRVLSECLDRRTVISGAIAAGAVGIGALEASTMAAPSRIHGLFSDWKILCAAYGSAPTEREADAIYRQITKLEDEALAITPETVQEFALLVLIVDADGDMDMSTTQLSLVKMCHRIATGG